MAETDINAGLADIEHGLGLLGGLVDILQDIEHPYSPAVVALAQKAGGLIERGAVKSGVMEWPSIRGGIDDWMGISGTVTAK